MTFRHTMIQNGVLLSSKCLRFRIMFGAPPSRGYRYNKFYIGDRDILCDGFNGNCFYSDHPMFPFPATRWKDKHPKYDQLLEKEKKDWNDLTIEEKKELYRYSFCQTYKEMFTDMPTWRITLAGLLFYLSFAITLGTCLRNYCVTFHDPRLTPHAHRRWIRKFIDTRGPITVDPMLANYFPYDYPKYWDYEKNQWKE